MAKWQTGPLNFRQIKHKPQSREDIELPYFQAANMGTETGMYPDPGGPDRRPQSWDDFVNKTGREKGAKVEVVDRETGATAGGHISYMDKKKDPRWDQFVESLENKDKTKPNAQVDVEPRTSRQENVMIQKLNVGREGSDEDSDGESEDDGGPGTKDVVKVLSFADHQRIKLERLFEKCADGRPVHIPDLPSKVPERDVNQAREFQHNIMGSCAGAGSGEFHAFRKSRRREYARQSILRYRQIRDEADAAFKEKLESQKQEAESKTAKKRAKRQKEKERIKKMRKNKGMNDNVRKESEDDSSISDSEPDDSKPVPSDPYSDPLMQHPESKPLVIVGNFNVQ